MRLFSLLASLALASCALQPAAAQTRIVAMTNGSGTITAANTSQQVFGQNTDRNFLFCQNPITATETLFIDYGRAASTTAGSVELAPGGSVSFLAAAVPVQTINVAAATAGHRFVCKQGGNN